MVEDVKSELSSKWCGIPAFLGSLSLQLGCLLTLLVSGWFRGDHFGFSYEAIVAGYYGLGVFFVPSGLLVVLCTAIQGMCFYEEHIFLTESKAANEITFYKDRWLPFTSDYTMVREEDGTLWCLD